MHNEQIELHDTGWAAEVELIASSLENGILLIRSCVDLEEAKNIVGKLANELSKISSPLFSVSDLRDMVEHTATEAVKLKIRKEQIVALKAATYEVERKNRTKLDTFKKRHVLVKENKAIVFMRNKKVTFKEIADYLSKRYEKQIKESGCAPFTGCDIYRSLNKVEKNSS